MSINTLGVTALLLASASPLLQASEQSESAGFIEGSKLSVKARNMYMQRDNRASGARQNYGEEWAQGFIGTFQSGFTQGTVGFGIDLIGQYAFRLDTGDGRTGGGTGLLEQDNHGAKQDMSKAGAVLKMRASNTVLKYGTQVMAVPVLATSDSRLLPETVDGFSLTSKEIRNLQLDAGHFTGLTNRNQSSRDSGRMTAVDYLGGVYTFNERLSSSLYYAKTAEHFRKYYVNTRYLLPLGSGQSLKFDFNAYDTQSIGQARSGDLDNRIWSLGGTWTLGAHAFTLAYQKVSGTGDYVYGPDGNAVYNFANSVQYSDFDYENEKSWQARYDLNMAAYGVPGLSFMTRYVKGTDFKSGTGGDLDGKAWERDVEVRYVVQAGVAKDLSFRVRQASYRSSERGGQIDEVRVITEYPLNMF
ncbi:MULTISPECIES: OprD family porin [Pseudomonas]|jgi:imipenem/basic amino acid-specific outer membrane pore|uniref:OprD family porin n=1 Tax=Pseudomonas TaxID=286 RepID=UPI00042118F0|nr:MULTISPECIES: OprD family porin [Pseudomonas]MBH3395447.1 OprD family porin [Pseudomonas monteilii]MCJ7853596.1 OprD family porin [Pseudomonas monteilii]SNB77027.1 imipenem/basic amino acid-specific outer membrane pore [Pseudomonas sp. URIL14HWK12:I8]SNS85094.1 imipenem/basic amino acid-specific outer membrane pore [Pseudomonas sp. LAMO17WK12:I8]SNY18244.1 imipenem/basic amino acid-specific outer membrane pore [Pseudomonas sp. LAMO17WK12:I11]